MEPATLPIALQEGILDSLDRTADEGVIWNQRQPRRPRTARYRPGRKAQALFEAGLQQHVAGAIEQAAALYNQALSLAPDYAEAHNNLAAALVSLGRLPEAVARYRRAIVLRPGYVEAHNNLGIALMTMDRPAEALTSYARAVALNPRNADLHYNVGVAMAANNRASDARASYEHALLLDPRHAEAHNNLGNLLCAGGHLDQAVTHYRAAIAYNPSHAPAHNNLANLLRDLGEFAEAAELYDRAVALDPCAAEAHYHRADLKTFTADDPDLETLGRLAQNPALNPRQSAFLHFALAKALDDSGDAVRAFEHLRRGNALKRSQLSYNETAAEELFRRIREVFSAGLMKGRQRPDDASELPVFVVGMPRSGTTLVEQILASHSRVHGAGELTTLPAIASSEFPSWVPGLSASDLERIGLAYLERLPDVPETTLRLIDKLPQNFLYIGLIYLALPGARIVHVTRNAVDTCLSCYSKLFASGQEFSYDLGELGRYYRLYEDLMQHWRTVLPEGAMLEVSYEELVEDLKGETARLLKYCGLDWDERCVRFHETVRPVKTASAVQVRQPLFRSSLERWRKYENAIGPLMEALEPVEAQRIAAD